MRINRPEHITITRTVERGDEYGDIVRYWVGGIAVMKDGDNRWGAFPDGTWAERPLFTKDTLEECLDMVAGAVALMQPAPEANEWDDNEAPPEGYGSSVVLTRLADEED